MSEQHTTDQFDVVELVQMLAAQNDWTHITTPEKTVIVTLTDYLGDFFVNVIDDNGAVTIVCVRWYSFNHACELEVRRLMDMINRLSSAPTCFLSEDMSQLTYRFNIDHSDERPLTSEKLDWYIKSLSSFFSRVSESFFALAGIQINDSICDDRKIVCLETPITANEALELLNTPVGHA